MLIILWNDEVKLFCILAWYLYYFPIKREKFWRHLLQDIATENEIFEEIMWSTKLSYDYPMPEGHAYQ